MKRMRLPAQAMQVWLRRVPRCTVLLLGVLIAVDTADCVVRLRAEVRRAASSNHVPAPAASFTGLEPQQIVGAHLFGVDPAAARSGTAGPSETASHLALSGVIATSDPSNGYAILGEPGQPTRLYRTGAALTNADSATLHQVFADHVVLDLGGRSETLSLPRQHLGIAGASRVARLEVPTAVSAGTDAIPLPISAREEAPTAAEGWFSNLYAERYTADGRTGLRLHPPKVFQRRYGLRDGDTLTAVNGVPVGDEDAVDSVLRAGGKTVALTLTRDGVEETMRFPVER